MVRNLFRGDVSQCSSESDSFCCMVNLKQIFRDAGEALLNIKYSSVPVLLNEKLNGTLLNHLHNKQKVRIFCYIKLTCRVDSTTIPREKIEEKLY